MSDWAPHLAFIDLDLFEPFIDIVGRGLTHGHTPIVAFTRRRDTALKLGAYERGADDILEVPFTLDEIVARPFALMRRAHGISLTIVPKIKLDGLEVDLIEQRVSVGGRDLHLTPIQQTLLYLLAANAGKALSREERRGPSYPRAAREAQRRVARAALHRNRARRRLPIQVTGDREQRRRLVKQRRNHGPHEVR